MLQIILLILFGVFLAYAVDKLYLEERFRRLSPSKRDEDLLVLEREPLVKILRQSGSYETLRRTQEVHRGRSLPRPSNRDHNLVQAGDRGDGQGVLPSSK
ncbi:MAG: hypothetical protein K1000chlam4_00905 [Chlamydiae bacterium]|nr:hypothetical protein [Chlamydiota bacterium]